jgi:hypothetical protein
MSWCNSVTFSPELKQGLFTKTTDSGDKHTLAVRADTILLMCFHGAQKECHYLPVTE